MNNWVNFNPVKIKRARIFDVGGAVKGEKPLIVTTQGSVQRGVIEALRRGIRSNDVVVWDDIHPNPDIENLDTAICELSKRDFDCIVGVGGGSVLDASKIFSVTIPLGDGGTLKDMFHGREVSEFQRRLPLILVPTTSGTGSEVTPFATVWDHRNKKKYSLNSEYMYSDIVFLDSSLTTSLDVNQTLYPALDAISHALESLWNKNRTPFSEIYAREALILANQTLPKLLHNLEDVRLREDMQLASVYAGLAISQTRTAIAHSISYPLTINLNIPHGLACSFTLPFLLKKNFSTLEKQVVERKLLDQTIELLYGFHLNDRIKKFANKKQIEVLLPEMSLSDRLSNYNGYLINGVEEIIEASL